MKTKSMLLLGIDTCGAQGGVALARLSPAADEASYGTLEVLAQTELGGKTYSARLVAAIRELLAAQGVSVADLHAIVVTSGPGSFTGIRVGLSAAKGLAEAQGTPLLAVSRLEVLAHLAGTQAAALDASRGEYYLGEFGPENSGGRELLVSRERFQDEAARLGDQLAVCEASVLALALHARSVPPPTAAQALAFALPRLREARFDDPALLDGDYLRRSDAEIFARPRTEVTIRSMTPADLAKVAAIAQACPEAPHWRLEDYAPFAQSVESEPRDAAESRPSSSIGAGWVALGGGSGGILGFAAARLVLDGEENRCELESIAVRVDARRQGTATALLRTLVAWAAERGARRLGLEVRASNQAAIRLYESLGLRPEGRRRGYYADPQEDALLLGAAVSELVRMAAFSTEKGS